MNNAVDYTRNAARQKLTLAELMKKFELKNKHVYSTEDYVLLRLDGKAFRTYTRDLALPYDALFMEAMDKTMLALCREIQGVRFGYVESDEISLLLTGWRNAPITELNPQGVARGELWMGGVASKLISLSAGMATAHFNKIREEQLIENPSLEREKFHRSLAYFDSRAWCFPGTESGDKLTEKYFMWRQIASMKNSTNMLARQHSTAQELRGMTDEEKKAHLGELGVSWDSLPEGFKYGRYAYGEKRTEMILIPDEKTQEPTPTEIKRTHWTLKPMVNLQEAIDTADVPLHIR